MHIAVLLGGASAERDVSIASGSRIIDALRSLGYQVTGVDPATGALTEAAERAMREATVKAAPPTLESLARLGGSNRRGRGEFIPDLVTLPVIREADVVFIGLHGGQGEDGTLQAILDSAGIAYTGSGHLASALAMDKDLSKALFRTAGVETADWIMNSPALNERVVIERLKLPLVVKPSKQGSTVGLSLVTEGAQLASAIALAAQYDDEVMLEQFIPGRELTVGVLGDTALPVGEIFPKHAIYDYECKYTVGMAYEEFPARLAPSETADAQRQAVAAFRALKLRGYARIDFRMQASGALACLEANTLPGMTGTSLIPQAAAAAGIAFPELCDRIVQLAIGRTPAA